MFSKTNQGRDHFSRSHEVTGLHPHPSPPKDEVMAKVNNHRWKYNDYIVMAQSFVSYLMVNHTVGT